MYRGNLTRKSFLFFYTFLAISVWQNLFLVYLKKMPVLFAEKQSLDLAPVAIFNEVFLARLDTTSPFSYIKKSAVLELDIFDGYFLIMIPISYKNKSSQFVFEIYEHLSENLVLGTHIVNELHIVSLQLQ